MTHVSHSLAILFIFLFFFLFVTHLHLHMHFEPSLLPSSVVTVWTTFDNLLK